MVRFRITKFFGVSGIQSGTARLQVMGHDLFLKLPFFLKVRFNGRSKYGNGSSSLFDGRFVCLCVDAFSKR